MLKKLAFTLVIGYSILLTYASLASLKNLPEVSISFADKIFHFSAYFVLAILWYIAFIYTFSLKKKKAIIYAVIISVTFGIVIEVLQHTLTDYRALDVYDIFANTLGVLIAILIIALNEKFNIKK